MGGCISREYAVCVAPTSSPGHSQFFNVSKKSRRAWLIVRGCEFCFLVQSLEVRFDNIARSVNKSESYQRLFQIHLTSWLGWSRPPTFLVNVEKLGVAVAWRRGYSCTCTLMCIWLCNDCGVH